MNDAKTICLHKIKDHPKKAVLLFRIMMRFEYALKEYIDGEKNRRYVKKSDRHDNKLIIQWDDYANKVLGKEFFDHIKKNDIAPTLTANPPKKQTLNSDGTLVFVDTIPCKNVQTLFGAIRRTRNNLFHGGKSGRPDEDRDDELVGEAIDVLIEALKHDDELRYIFEGTV